MDLTPHFTLDELLRSEAALRQGIPNQPNDEQLHNLQRLCEVLLEPARAILGPIHVNSGFRSPALNEAVHGAHNSAHLDGRAADLIPVNYDLRRAFDTLRVSSLPFDQIIIECNAWIHLAVARKGETPRRQALSAFGTPGHWTYSEVNHGA
jgi:hypothetical protein